MQLLLKYIPIYIRDDIDTSGIGDASLCSLAMGVSDFTDVSSISGECREACPPQRSEQSNSSSSPSSNHNVERDRLLKSLGELISLKFRIDVGSSFISIADNINVVCSTDDGGGQLESSPLSQALLVYVVMLHEVKLQLNYKVRTREKIGKGEERGRR